MSKSKKLIEKFCEGKTNSKESLMALHLMALDPKLEQYAKDYDETEKFVQVLEMRRDYHDAIEKQYSQYIPIYSHAAADGKNLCDLQCENFILKQFGISNDNQSLAEEARTNYWLREAGMPLFNMGRVMEHNGLYVHRLFNATRDNLIDALNNSEHVIVVVNNEMLTRGADTENDLSPNHAVVVKSVDIETNKVVTFNPSSGNVEDIYPLDIFLKAWSTSKYYLVTARKAKEHEYNPQPVDVSMVELNPELLELTETIAENAHDVWAIKRFAEGLVYGPENIDKKTNKDLLPYYQLPDSEKQYDRDMAINTIKLLIRLGYRILNVNKMYRCPHCGNTVEPHYHYCCFCGEKLEPRDFM